MPAAPESSGSIPCHQGASIRLSPWSNGAKFSVHEKNLKTAVWEKNFFTKFPHQLKVVPPIFKVACLRLQGIGIGAPVFHQSHDVPHSDVIGGIKLRC
jgi:hypothetical protein